LVKLAFAPAEANAGKYSIKIVNIINTAKTDIFLKKSNI
jgi:hypothetical protein